MNDVIFMMMFICWRFGLGILFCYRIVLFIKLKFFVKLGGIGMYLISLVWVFFIIRFVKKRFFGKGYKK